MKVNLKGFQGKVSKPATIVSNDSQTPEVTVKIEGTVIALIDTKPSSNVIFRGMADQLTESVVDLIGSVPFHITSSESNLGDNVSYKMETVENGKHYKLAVANKLNRGNYAGYIKLVTDLPQKPDMLVRVNGYIEGEIAVKPQTVLIGKLSSNQPERLGKIAVTSNRNKAFQITRLTYDENLMTVVQQPLDKEVGFSLEITPKLENVPVGSRKQVTLSIETDASPGAKDDVQIHLFNSADQPEAAPK